MRNYFILPLTVAMGFTARGENRPSVSENSREKIRIADEIKSNNLYFISKATVELVSGAFDQMSFKSELRQPGKIAVTFTRPNGTIVIDIDLKSQTIDIDYPGDTSITEKDRDLFNKLAYIIEYDLGKSTAVTDNLVRQAALFGAHPVAPIQIKEISGFGLQSWQTLCSGQVNSSRAFEWDVGGSNHRQVLPYGPLQSWCASRCGPSCYSVGTSAWTQDCGNHDYCEEFSSTSDCMDEFVAASDDYSFAPNCNY